MLFKIAFRNVRRQIGGYLIYFFTVALTVAFLFSLSLGKISIIQSG